MSGMNYRASPESGPASHDQEVNLLDVLLLFSRSWRVLLLSTLMAGALGLGASFLMKVKYTAQGQIMVPQSGPSSTLGSLLGGGGVGAVLGGGLLPGLKNPADQWVGLLTSRTLLDAMVDQFGLMSVYGSEFRFQSRDTLASSSRMVAKKDGLISIEVDDTDPKRAAAMVNGYITQLQKLSNTLAVTESGQRRLFLEKQTQQALQNLKKADAAIRAAGVSVDILKLSPVASMDQIARLRAEIASKEVQVSVMRGTMVDSNPDLQMVLRELAALRVQLTSLNRAQPESAASGAQYSDAYREFKYQETLYELLARQFEVAKAEEAREGALIQVVDAATVPEWKSSPKRGIITVASMVAGFIMALGYVIVSFGVRQYRNDPVNAAKLQRLSGRGLGR